jgi:hypothetical protein
MKNDPELYEHFSRELGLDVIRSMEELEEKLAAHINILIEKDFQRLLVLLYTIDVDENKLRSLLKEKSGEDAGGIIARMMIERQLQKIQSRQQYRENTQDDGSQEKW